MSLLDGLTGGQTGPSGQQAQGTADHSMSPVIMALLGVLAHKALNNLQDQSSTSADVPPSGLGDILGGLGEMLSGQKKGAGGEGGGLLAGGLGSILTGNGSIGSIFSSGLSDLLRQFQQSGQGDVMRSWIGKGPNETISPVELGNALGEDQLKKLMTHSGLSRDELLARLSQHLPDVINQLTPDGRLPSEQELSRTVGKA
jgi:uncharacterized protein YidB (DUF937 family)